jgi:hypothetical protein
MEKRGFTGKLINDFESQGVLEVFIQDAWFRVIATEFRSFDGPRRIGIPGNTKHYAKLTENDEQIITSDYHGPVYLYRTNTVIPYSNTQKVRR